MRLNLGSGRTKLEGFVNVDRAINDPDVVMDIDNAPLVEWCTHFGKSLITSTDPEIPDRAKEPQVEYSQLIHVIEHLHNPLVMMENLWYVTKPGGLCYVRCPHGASDDAWEDPTHVRPYFPGSFLFFSQPAYHRADYGYQGDWKVIQCDLIATHPQMAKNVNYATLGRNSVREIVVTMECVKPARAHDRELMDEIRPVYKTG